MCRCAPAVGPLRVSPSAELVALRKMQDAESITFSPTPTDVLMIGFILRWFLELFLEEGTAQAGAAESRLAASGGP